MRRQDQEISDRAELEAILAQAAICRLGMVDGDWPYVVPVCFGYEDNALYVHCASEGKKLDILARHPQVCFEMEVDVKVVPAPTPCAWSVRYSSLIGWGHATILHDVEEKHHALDILMAHYGDQGPHVFSKATLANLSIIRINIERLTGKRSRH